MPSFHSPDTQGCSPEERDDKADIRVLHQRDPSSPDGGTALPLEQQVVQVGPRELLLYHA